MHYYDIKKNFACRNRDGPYNPRTPAPRSPLPKSRLVQLQCVHAVSKSFGVFGIYYFCRERSSLNIILSKYHISVDCGLDSKTNFAVCLILKQYIMLTVITFSFDFELKTTRSRHSLDTDTQYVLHYVF